MVMMISRLVVYQNLMLSILMSAGLEWPRPRLGHAQALYAEPLARI